MAVYALSDLHLSLGIEEKPMDIFGERWENHVNKIKENWCKMIHEDDYVLIAGDFSWATYLEDTIADFQFLESLPGKKILLKGNHDYWWTTVTKMNQFLEKNDLKSIQFLYNNAFELEKYVICGTRYWGPEEEFHNEKIFHRECERAKISLLKAQQLNANKPIIFMTHYPPDERIIECTKGFRIKYWIYGHIHSNYEENIVKLPSIECFLTSFYYLHFVPLIIDI